jgi:hypothetical protein
MWVTLTNAKVEYAFACVFLVALNELELILVERQRSGKTSADGSTHEVPRTTATSYVEPVSGIAVEHPDLHVTEQLGENLHFLKDEPSYFLLAESLAVLGKLLKIAPDEFALVVANSDIMAILQTIFRSE